MGNNQARFLQFPITLLKKVWSESPKSRINAFGEIIDYGLIETTKRRIKKNKGYAGLHSATEREVVDEFAETCNFLDMNINTDTQKEIKGKINLWERYNKDDQFLPKPFIPVDMALEFYNKKKSLFDLEQLTGYIACRSILGRKLYASANTSILVARMIGLTSSSNLPQSGSNKAYEDNRAELEKSGRARLKTLIALSKRFPLYSTEDSYRIEQLFDTNS